MTDTNNRPGKEEFVQTGFFETIVDDATGKTLGTRHGVNPQPGRVTGYNGARSETHTKPFQLTCGHKTVTIKASEKKPVRVTTFLFPQSGVRKWRHPFDPA